VQTKAPFTIGCYGPNADNSVVTLAQCRAVYSGCSSTAVTYNVQTGTTWPKTLTGTVSIKLWCPCYDADGSNTGTNALPCEKDPTATGCKKAAEETQAFSYQPALKTSSPTKAPVVTTSRPSLLRTKADGAADDAAVAPTLPTSAKTAGATTMTVSWGLLILACSLAFVPR
jgi:hypothetical protein